MSGVRDDEVALRLKLMEADMANKIADTEYKRELVRWEPWKAMSAAFGAGVAVASALLAGGVWLAQHLGVR